jgi:hypothetical protein
MIHSNREEENEKTDLPMLGSSRQDLTIDSEMLEQEEIIFQSRRLNEDNESVGISESYERDVSYDHEALLDIHKEVDQKLSNGSSVYTCSSDSSDEDVSTDDSIYVRWPNNGQGEGKICHSFYAFNK